MADSVVPPLQVQRLYSDISLFWSIITLCLIGMNLPAMRKKTSRTGQPNFKLWTRRRSKNWNCPSARIHIRWEKTLTDWQCQSENNQWLDFVISCICLYIRSRICQDLRTNMPCHLKTTIYGSRKKCNNLLTSSRSTSITARGPSVSNEVSARLQSVESRVVSSSLDIVARVSLLEYLTESRIHVQIVKGITKLSCKMKNYTILFPLTLSVCLGRSIFWSCQVDGSRSRQSI